MVYKAGQFAQAIKPLAREEHVYRGFNLTPGKLYEVLEIERGRPCRDEFLVVVRNDLGNRVAIHESWFRHPDRQHKENQLTGDSPST